MKLEEDGYLSDELEYLIDVKHRQPFINRVREVIRLYHTSPGTLKDALAQFKVYRVTQISNKNTNDFIEVLIKLSLKKIICNNSYK